MFPAVHDCHGCVRLDLRADSLREKGTKREPKFICVSSSLSLMFLSCEVSRLKK